MNAASLAAPLTAGAVALVWTVVALRGGMDLGFTATPFAAAAAAGTALLAGRLALPRHPVDAAISGIALVALPLAVAQVAGGGSGLVLAATVVALAALGAPSWRAPEAVAGAILVAAALALRARAGEAALAAGMSSAEAGLLLGGAFALVAAATADDDRSPAVAPLLVPALVVGLAAARAVEPAVGIAAAAVLAAAFAWRRAPHALPIGLLALGAAAAGPSLRPAAVLLAVAAVLVAALDEPWAVVVAVPGITAATIAVEAAATAEARAFAIAAAVVGGIVVVRTAWAAAAPTPPTADQVATRGPAAVAAVWLLLAPGSWAVAGEAGLAAYDRGAPTALAAGLAALVLSSAWTRRASGTESVSPRPGR